MTSSTRKAPGHKPRYARRRRGSFLVWCAFLLVVLIGMTGLVIDGGFMLATYRHSQNAADAAAMAAALDLLRGKTDADAIATGTAFGSTHNDLAGATVVINIPPATGPYAGNSQFAEALVTVPLQSFFIQVLPGFDTNQDVTARAVAGYEFVAAGEGVITLDCHAKPGLKVTGQANLVVEGDIYVNSAGGGVDAEGNPVTTGENKTAMTVNNNASVEALNINVVGGVNNPDNFHNYVEGGPNPLNANASESPDPFAIIPAPCVTHGVVNVRRGAPQASSGTLALNNASDNSDTPNFIEVDPMTAEETMVLHPGIYDEIKITGGKVRFVPGIYVISPQYNLTFALDITGGDVTAEGIMFYNAGSDYDPNVCNNTGNPDPCNQEPSDAQFYGGVKINASMSFTPIDTTAHSYIPAVDDHYNQFLFFQSRDNDSVVQIEGNSAEGNLSGTLYARKAEVKLAGQGTYDAQFAVGSMEIDGQGDITIKFDGDDVGKAPRVFLVE